MKVMKLGGTPVGSSEQMKNVVSFVARSGEQIFAVLSAMSGTISTLIEIIDYLYKKNPEGTNEAINTLEEKYMQRVDELYATDKYKTKTCQSLVSEFEYLRSLIKDLFTSFEEKCIVVQGEIMSINTAANYLQEQGVHVVLLSALDFIRTGKNAEPGPPYTKEKFSAIVADNEGYQIYITQGFICRSAHGEVGNLLRGGSDYTVSLIGAAPSAEETVIQTDIDGIHNNDPRIVDKTDAVQQLNFEEATELAYLGAKILHPTCIQPARYAGIPVRLKNTMEPNAYGTIIDNVIVRGKIEAVATKDNIAAIKTRSFKMLLVTGFLRKVLEIFESYQTPIDMIATSEVGLSISIDNVMYLDEIADELKKYGTVTVDTDMHIIRAVSDLDWSNVGFEILALDVMKDIPVRMISYGGDNCNISLLVREADRKRASQSLSNLLFETTYANGN